MKLIALMAVIFGFSMTASAAFTCPAIQAGKYTCKDLGTNETGTVTVTLPQFQGQPFAVYFDDPTNTIHMLPVPCENKSGSTMFCGKKDRSTAQEKKDCDDQVGADIQEEITSVMISSSDRSIVDNEGVYSNIDTNQVTYTIATGWGIQKMSDGSLSYYEKFTSSGAGSKPYEVNIVCTK